MQLEDNGVRKFLTQFIRDNLNIDKTWTQIQHDWGFLHKSIAYMWLNVRRASGASDKTKVRPNMNKKEAMRVKNDSLINTLYKNRLRIT